MTTVLMIILIALAIYYLIGIYLAIGWSQTWPYMKHVWIAIVLIALIWPFLVYINDD